MSHWNYRVFRHTEMIVGKEHESFSIHECYYNDKGEPDGWTENPVEPFGDTIEELKICYQMMAEAFEKPFLEYISDE